MLNLQEALRNGVSLDRLQSDLGIYSKRHPVYPNLIQFGYDQIESAKDKYNPIVVESRGIILNESADWQVVAYPFNRFFNLGEGVSQFDIDWKTARVQEKVDGSLMIVYYYDEANSDFLNVDKWHVATRGSINAAGSVGDNPFTFSELFWRVFKNQFDGNTLKSLNVYQTYMFELVSKYNRVVCDHSEKEGELILIGSRNNLNFAEGDIQHMPLNPVKEFSLGTFDDVVKAAEALNPMQQEGFVVVDGEFRRVKIKSPKYVAIHHLQDGFGPRRIVDLIKLGEISEILSYYPEYMKIYDEIEQRINMFASELDAFYMGLTRTPITRKEFAIRATAATKNPGALFAILDGKVKNSREFMFTLPSDKILNMIGMKNVE